MALISRVTLAGPPAEEPEDFLGSSLGAIFPDDVTALHRDLEHDLLCTTPHLPKAFRLSLADVTGEEARRLFQPLAVELVAAPG